MNHKILIVIILLFTISISDLKSQITLSGKITDEKNQSLEFVSILIKENQQGTVSNQQGYYQIKLKEHTNFTIIYSSLGYTKKTINISTKSKDIIRNIVLTKKDKTLEEVNIIGEKKNENGLQIIKPELIITLPNVSGNSIESLLKTLAGVSSTSELSSQYNVRGGNFDENLVYVNDIQVYRPFLIRSGQQEGLSFINSDLVESIEFSAGGFSAKYGDKMSSVLDIKYKEPKKFGAGFSASLLGTSAYIQNNALSDKLSFISGVRYKSSQYLLNSLETKGDYKPNFFDFQTYINYNLNKKFKISLLGNIAQNKYNFIPGSKKTTIGTLANSLGLFIDYNGQEKDKYLSYFGAVSFKYQNNKNFIVKFISSYYQSYEQEKFDILGSYSLNALDKQYGSKTFGDSILNLGVGSYLDHAKNYLDINVYNSSLLISYFGKKISLYAGFKYQSENILDKINEWQLIDSAGYSISFNREFDNDKIILNKSIQSKNALHTKRYTSYLLSKFPVKTSKGKFEFTGGLRFHYWDYNNQLLFSPRFAINYIPLQRKNITFRFASGYYYQPPFYRELRNLDGSLEKKSKAQESIHFVLGSYYTFKAWNRLFKFTSELYYKHMDNIIPYELNNIRIQYYANQRAKAYATGLDLKLYGEFVKGIDSWITLSLMQTKEDIYNDIGYRYYDEKNKPTNNIYEITDTVIFYPGYIPRPTDQWLNVGIYFQDYWPGNDNIQMQVSFIYGAALPYGPPNTYRYLATNRMHPDYVRVDLGLSTQLIKKKTKTKKSLFKSCWLSFEVFNLLGIKNTVSYSWVTVVPNLTVSQPINSDSFAVPNKLTSRRFNIKLTCKF